VLKSFDTLKVDTFDKNSVSLENGLCHYGLEFLKNFSKTFNLKKNFLSYKDNLHQSPASPSAASKYLSKDSFITFFFFAHYGIYLTFFTIVYFSNYKTGAVLQLHN